LSNVLLVPDRAVRLVKNQHVVYVLQNGQPHMVKITLGASSDTQSEVASGDLKAGDVVILNPLSSPPPPPRREREGTSPGQNFHTSAACISA